MPVIRISDYVFELMKNYAIPFEDTPDSTLKRILEDYARMKNYNREPLPSNTSKLVIEKLDMKKSITKYARWIIASLVFLGGRAKANEVFSHIQEAFKDEFTSKELETLSSGELRWAKQVNWARYDMVKGGFLVGDSPHGIWELTEKGKNIFDDYGKNIMKGDSKMHITRREYGKLCRRAFEKHLSERWGQLDIKGSWYISKINDNKVLTLYSDLNNDRWFYGIMYDYWHNLDMHSHLALIMRDGSRCSYVLLNPNESIEIISRIKLSKDNSKKINVRIPSVGRIYIQEWPDFPFEERTVDIGTIDPEEATFDKIAKKIATMQGIPIEDLKKALAKVMASETEQANTGQ